MHTLQYLTAGKPLPSAVMAGGAAPADRPDPATKALILLHGRGGSADDILTLADALPVKDFAVFAPQAATHSWYPYSFMAPIRENEPWLSSALGVLKALVNEIKSHGITEENIWFAGFSQGACLMLEFITRNATRYGGAAAFTGGLIGDRIYPQHYEGDFRGTPIFIGTSDPDPHVPVQRVHETTALLKQMHADVTEEIYPRMGHTITNDELRTAGRLVFELPAHF
jgi:phospholipase/carboxylesterase